MQHFLREAPAEAAASEVWAVRVVTWVVGGALMASMQALGTRVVGEVRGLAC